MSGKKIALFGGSFNPPHEGHFKMGQYIEEALGVDEVWFLFTENWQKDPTAYASIQHRMKMGKLMGQHYPDQHFEMSNIEEDLGTHLTCEVLPALQNRFPDHRFIFVMGADNLASFHTWEHFDRIVENFPIAVLNRPPYTEQAAQSYTALTYAHLQVADPKELLTAHAGWCFLKNAQIDLSSSSLLRKLHSGQTQFDGPFQSVADYIFANKLYGIDQAASRVPSSQNITIEKRPLPP